MNILYTLNDKFVPQVGTCICSVCENNKNVNDITFYVVSYGITSDNKKKLKQLVRSYKRKINIIELDDLKKYFDFDFDTLGWSPVIVARLLVDKLIKDDIDRILYLDGDTLVVDSLEEFYKMNLKGKTLAMSIEPTVNKNRFSELNIEGYSYHNSGVLLIDLKKWKKINAGEKVINYYRKHDGKLFAADQDAINGALKSEIYSVLPRYNFYNIFYIYPYKYMKKLMKPLDYFSKDEYEYCKKNPCIIHYLGEERPWRKGNTHKYRNEYIKYLSLTPWKDNEFEDGWKIYFVFWRIFNFVMKPFPRLRHKIINGLIPTFMKFRANKLKKNKEK